MRVIAEIVYQDKKTLNKFAIKFDVNEIESEKAKKSALRFAKQARPKFHRILSVSISYHLDM